MPQPPFTFKVRNYSQLQIEPDQYTIKKRKGIIRNYRLRNVLVLEISSHREAIDIAVMKKKAMFMGLFDR